MAQREEQADGDRPLVLLHQFPRHVVDGGDVVGVDGVAQAEAVGQKAQAQRRRIGIEQGQRQAPGSHVQPNEKEIDPEDSAPQRIALGSAESWWRSL